MFNYIFKEDKLSIVSTSNINKYQKFISTNKIIILTLFPLIFSNPGYSAKNSNIVIGLITKLNIKLDKIT